jgi:hypothetical protein
MRATVVALSLVVAQAALAEAPQADDDERPGEAAASSDTPSSDEGPRPVLRGKGRASGTVDEGAAKRRMDEQPLKLQQGKVDPAHPEGSYAGVSIGGEGLPPRPPKLPVAGPQRMLWPGFQVRDGVPTVFLQTTGVPNYAVRETANAIQVTLRGTKIQLRNNRRPLKVAEFGTAITEITAAPRGKDVVVTIKHKGGAAHRERVEASAGGYQLLVVELPGK